MKEYEIAEYILLHSDQIKSDLGLIANAAKDNPILRSHFRDAMVDEVTQVVATGLNIPYAEVAEIATYDFVVQILSEEFFKL